MFPFVVARCSLELLRCLSFGGRVNIHTDESKGTLCGVRAEREELCRAVSDRLSLLQQGALHGVANSTSPRLTQAIPLPVEYVVFLFQCARFSPTISLFKMPSFLAFANVSEVICKARQHGLDIPSFRAGLFCLCFLLHCAEISVMPVMHPMNKAHCGGIASSWL